MSRYIPIQTLTQKLCEDICNKILKSMHSQGIKQTVMLGQKQESALKANY